MAKQGMSVVKPKGGKLIGLVLVLVVLYLVITQPTEMAAFFNDVLAWLKSAAVAIGTFVRSLSG